MTDEQITEAAELLRDIGRLERSNVELGLEILNLTTAKNANVKVISVKRQKLAELAGRN